jgi:hypothetical protein
MPCFSAVYALRPPMPPLLASVDGHCYTWGRKTKREGRAIVSVSAAGRGGEGPTCKQKQKPLSVCTAFLKEFPCFVLCTYCVVHCTVSTIRHRLQVKDPSVVANLYV